MENNIARVYLEQHDMPLRKSLVRWSRTAAVMVERAKKIAAAIGAGHNWIISLLGNGLYLSIVVNPQWHRKPGSYSEQWRALLKSGGSNMSRAATVRPLI